MKNIFLIILCLFSFSFSYSYSAFSLMTGENTLAINPFISVDNEGNFSHDIYTTYGITNKFDIWSHLSFTPKLNKFNASCMLRYDFTGKNTIAAILANGKHFSPQLHWIWENEKVILQSNIIVQFNYDYIKKPAIYAIFSPAIKIRYGLIDIFCEINPGYYMLNQSYVNHTIRSEGFNFDIVPGFGFVVKNCIFSLSCPVYNIINKPEPTFGLWWFFTIVSAAATN